MRYRCKICGGWSETRDRKCFWCGWHGFVREPQPGDGWMYNCFVRREKVLDSNGVED
jgi:hypothetical protein